MNIIELLFDKDNYRFSFVFDLLGLLVLVLLFFGIKFLLKKINSKMNHKVKLKKIGYKILGVEHEYEIQTNYQNVEIAHKIYIELITRKAAIAFDEQNDVISQVYDSWYKLFDITRKELKTYTGDIILSEESDEVTKLLTDILNKGLRPHLTKHQAKFRRWLDNELEKEENKTKNPQDIQKEYFEYDDLVTSLKEVNTSLRDYSNQLKNVWN